MANKTLVFVLSTCSMMAAVSCALEQSIPWTSIYKAADKAATPEPKQKWNYVDVRPNAHMFWWVYYTTAPGGANKKPLVIWLQGGPGGSSTGFGNFQEIGPLDVTLMPRETTWLQSASLLFIDNPVGTGYSYVTHPSAYTTNNDQIATDLLTLLTSFMTDLPEFQTSPLYIFSESYGGKMTASFSQMLHKAVLAGQIECNFQGFAMGDSWISPLDSVLTWGPYLYATSLVDESGFDKINSVANEIKMAIASGAYKNATELWSKEEDTVNEVTNGVNFYNILDWSGGDNYRQTLSQSKNYIDRLYARHVSLMQNDDLSALMNGPIRVKLGVIPANITWGAQSGDVFSALKEDFMKPVVEVVDDLVTYSNLKVVVYSGQLDLIVDTLGTEMWVKELTWPGLPKYQTAKREQLKKGSRPLAYVKQHENFSFYWILDAGHMVPSDAGDAALLMLNRIIGS